MKKAFLLLILMLTAGSIFPQQVVELRPVDDFKTIGIPQNCAIKLVYSPDDGWNGCRIDGINATFYAYLGREWGLAPRIFTAGSIPAIVQARSEFGTPGTLYIYELPSMGGPVISPSGGIVRPGAKISISPPAGYPDCDIRYTANGTEPTSSSLLYETPIPIYDNVTIKAIAIYEPLTSPVAAKTFQIGWSPPEIFPASARFQAGDEVEVSITNSPNNNGEGTILFRYNYGPGQTGWTQYVNPIIVTETSTIEAKVAGSDGESDVVSATYEFVQEKVATPVISPTGGAFTELPAVEITCTTQGATIYYTTNGTEPSSASPVYSGPITLIGSCRVKTFAAKAGMGDSDKVSRAYILDAPLPQGNASDEDYNDYLNSRNGLFDQYETFGNNELLDDIIRLDSDWSGGGSSGSGTGTGDTTGGDSGGGTGTGDTGSGGAGSVTGNTGGTSGGTSSYTTNEGDSSYFSTSNTYNSNDNSSGNTDYFGLGAIGVIGVLPFMMKQETHPSINGGGASNEEKNDNDSWSKRIYFTK